MKFKVGDRVRVFNHGYALAPPQHIGIIKMKSGIQRGDWQVYLNGYGSSLGFYESEMELIEESDMKRIQIKVDSEQPEATGAIIRLLVGLGYPDKYDYETSRRVPSEAGWLYLRGNVIDGWNHPDTGSYPDYKMIDTTKKVHTVQFDNSEPVEISAESFAALKGSLK